MSKIIKSRFTKEVYRKNAEVYKILANPIRLEILNALSLSPLSVQQITALLGIKKANVSQHLALLRYARVVETKRFGQKILYHITDRRIVEPCRILKNIWQTKTLA